MLQENVNFIISRFVPDFVTQGIIDHDYAMLALRRYAEATRNFWAQMIKKVKTQTHRTVTPISSFQKTEMRKYKQTRKKFDAAQARYDTLLQRYMSASKHKEPSALREDAFQASEARTAYIHASFDLACEMANIERHVNAVLIETLADPWIVRTKSLIVGDPSYFQIGVDMYRLRSWSRSLSHGLKNIESEMLRLRKEMEDSLVSRISPSRDLGEYLPQTANVAPNSTTKGSETEKHGWVFVKTTPLRSSGSSISKQTWVRQWAFVKDGVFGWLTISPSRTFVQETDKIGVLLCNVSPDPSEDRRFCFEVRTKDATIIVQAESLADLKSWLEVFDAAKRKVVDSANNLKDTQYAFQETHPIIAEFAAANSNLSEDAGSSGQYGGSNAPGSPRKSVDTRTSGLQSSGSTSSSGGALTPLTGAISGITTGINTGISTITGVTLGSSHGSFGRISGPDCLNTPNASQLHAHMNAGKNAILASVSEISNGQFSSLGDCQASLSPLTLVNVPMPTSMTREALLTNAFIGYSTVPNAITGNYWGTVNWAVYQRAQGDKNNSLEPFAGLTKSVVVPQTLKPYPSYYPIHLQSQDAQMHAMFQGIASDYSESNYVTMVFRALVRPNLKQELPAKIFVTCNRIYIYSCTFGFVALGHIPLRTVVSVEGSTSTGWDTLHLLKEDGASFSMRVYIDSGRVIRRRLQYLIDNCKSEEPANVEKALKRLNEIGVDKQKRFDAAIRDRESKLRGFADGDEDASNKDIDSKDASHGGDAGAEDMDDDNDENGYGYTNKQLLQHYLTTPLSKKRRAEVPTMTASQKVVPVMDRLMAEQEFEIPAKALFYSVFGERSPVFKWVKSSLYNRERLDISPWVEVGAHHRLEREIKFFAGALSSSQPSALTSQTDGFTYNLQRVEHKEDNNLYVVYDRRSPWELPYGSVFYVATRYIITAQSKSRSKISVWTTVEWIRSSKIARGVVKGLIYRHLQNESMSVVESVTKCVQKLGHRSTIIGAISAYGRVEGVSGPKEGHSDVDEAVQHETTSSLRPLPVSNQYYILGGTVFALKSWAVDILSSVFLFLASLGQILWRSISMNKFLVTLLSISVMVNLLLVSRSSVSFWADRTATRIVRELDVIPDSATIMRRSLYLQEITDAVNEGRGLAFEPNGLCYDKFRSLLYYAPFDSPLVDIDLTDFPLATDWTELDVRSKETSKRIRHARTNVAVQRNDLLASLRVLNRLEEDYITREWRDWVTHELDTCRAASEVVSVDKIRDYCTSCLAEWKNLANKSLV